MIPGVAIKEDVERVWSHLAKHKRCTFEQLIPLCGNNSLRARAAINQLKHEDAAEEHPQKVFQLAMSPEKRETVKQLSDSLEENELARQAAANQQQRDTQQHPEQGTEMSSEVASPKKRTTSEKPTILDQAMELVEAFPGATYRDLLQLVPTLTEAQASAQMGNLYRKHRAQRYDDRNNSKRGIMRYFPLGFDMDAWFKSEAYEAKRAEEASAAKAAQQRQPSAITGEIPKTVTSGTAAEDVRDNAKTNNTEKSSTSTNVIAIGSRRKTDAAALGVPDEAEFRDNTSESPMPRREVGFVELALHSILERVREHLSSYDIKILSKATGIDLEKNDDA